MIIFALLIQILSHMKTKLTCFLTLVFVMLMQISFAQDQTKTINGTVADDDGLPIPGVNITIEDTDQGTTTDFDGNYSIEAAPGQVLIFTAVGFADQTATVGLEDQIDITMGGDVLDEVIITAFGRKLTRNETTSSVVTVGSEDIEKSPFVDVQQALQGRVSGMTVSSTSGAPGASPIVRIRGMNSINAGNDPLYVIDGVPVNSGNISVNSEMVSGTDMMALIGSSNIESVSVLKDASAVAPYGAEGANGVILITTKSGKKGEAKYNLTYTTGFNNSARKGVEMMNGEQKLEAAQLAFVNGGLPPTNMDEAYDFLIGNVPGVQLWEAAGRPNINWYDELRNKDALMMDANFSVNQGSETSNFHASLGMNKTEGTVLGAEFKRVSGNLKYNTQLNDKLNLQVSANVSNADQDGSPDQGSHFTNPNLSRYFLSPWALPYDENGDPSIGADWQAGGGGLHNTLYTLDKNIYNNNTTRAIQNTELSYDILDNLTFKTMMGIDYTLVYGKRYNNPIHGDGEDANGYIVENSNRYFKYTTQNTLDYNFTLNDVHNFNLTGVQEFSKYKDDILQGYGDNLPNEFLQNLSATSANYEATSVYSDRMAQRYVGLLSYNFDKKYLVDASYSYQGDSRFSKKFGNFYSIGLGWNIHRENFMENADWVNELRLRAGHGLTGNAGIGRNKYQALMAYNSYRNMPSGYISEYGTTATWEKSKRLDAAIEFGMFDNRLNGSIGYYSNKTVDMLLSVPTPHSSLFLGNGVLDNVGEMTNKGLEVELSGDVISTSDFNWNLGGNFSTLANKITYIPEESEVIGLVNVRETGHLYNEWRLKEWAGIDPENGDALWYVNRETHGDETTNDYTEAEEIYQGKNPMPTYSGSIMTRFDYKNFFLEGQLYFAGGHKVFQQWAGEGFIETTDGGTLLNYNASVDAFNGAWRQPGDDATYPRFDYGSDNVANAGQYSTRFLHDGDFMRLRDIAVGYTFDRDQLQGTFLDGVTLSVRGTNLWTWVKDSALKLDPEISPTGAGMITLTTPPIKSLTFNVNINF